MIKNLFKTPVTNLKTLKIRIRISKYNKAEEIYKNRCFKNVKAFNMQ